MATLTRENSFSLTNPLEKEGDPKGTPSMQISSVGTSTTPASPKGHGVLMLELSHDHSHFLGLRTRPSGGPLTRSSSHTWRRMGTGATIPPSSMYHFWYTGPRAAISSTKGASAKQKYKGPRGSPC